MTVGKDVSSLFTDVVNCMQTENLELKKLVYLYLINYAKSQPDLAILAVNTFVKVTLKILTYSFWTEGIFTKLLVCNLQDSQDPNPLIRALAVRTMGCIRVDKIPEYLCDPLQKCLKVGIEMLALHWNLIANISTVLKNLFHLDKYFLTIVCIIFYLGWWSICPEDSCYLRC